LGVPVKNEHNVQLAAFVWMRTGYALCQHFVKNCTFG
jgi:hypothetical protein